MLQMPSWSGSIFTGGESQRYPFRVNAMWRREIIGGKYAEVVNKKKITVIFQIKLNAKTPETPVFSVRDYDEGVFAREFTAPSFSELSRLWLTQNGQTGLTLADMQGKTIVGLDNPGVAEYFCSITSGFQGFRRNIRTRGAGDKGVEDIGSRHQRRLKTSLLEDFETALGKVCPQDLGQARERCLAFRPSTIMGMSLQRLMFLWECGFSFTRESGVASCTRPRIVTLCCCRMRDWMRPR
jgi:hypothetical protein